MNGHSEQIGTPLSIMKLPRNALSIVWKMGGRGTHRGAWTGGGIDTLTDPPAAGRATKVWVSAIQAVWLSLLLSRCPSPSIELMRPGPGTVGRLYRLISSPGNRSQLYKNAASQRPTVLSPRGLLLVQHWKSPLCDETGQLDLRVLAITIPGCNSDCRLLKS